MEPCVPWAGAESPPSFSMVLFCFSIGLQRFHYRAFRFYRIVGPPVGPWAEAFGDEAKCFLKACRRKATDFDIGPGITFTVAEVGGVHFETKRPCNVLVSNGFGVVSMVFFRLATVFFGLSLVFDRVIGV